MDKNTPKPSMARERILQTALRLFYANGIHATGIDAIIKESDVAKMTFYKHFPSKQALVLEYLKERDRRSFAWFTERVQARAAHKPEKALLAVFDVLEEWFGHPDFLGCPFVRAATENTPGSAECAFSEGYKKRVETYLEDLARQAKVKQPKRIAEQLLLLMEGATVRAMMENSPKPAKMAKAMALALLGP